MPFEVIRFGRAWWFGGKYLLAGYELFILGASVWSLSSDGRALSKILEAACHFLCVCLGVAAFSVFWVQCLRINSRGFNKVTETEAQTSSVDHLRAVDDNDDELGHINDDARSIPTTAIQQFAEGWQEYNSLVRVMLLAWDGLLILTLFTWVFMRIVFFRAVRRWHANVVVDAAAQQADVWAQTRRDAWRARQQLHDTTKRDVTAVSKPLEKYWVVYVLCSIPAAVMSTSYCQNQSRSDTVQTGYYQGLAYSMTFGTCYSWCELVLAMRTLATVVIYLVSREPLSQTPNLQVKSLVASNNGNIQASGGTPTIMSEHHSTPTWTICEEDLAVARRIGAGTFGEVWEGLLRGTVPVAIKVFQNSDQVQSSVSRFSRDVFARECAALKKIDHPNLLKCLGFGSTTCARRFIVTELMSAGSLKDMLHIESVDLSWTFRMSIAIQVASGMAHLHGIPLIHRDLKSDNILLDEIGRVVVGDFGTSRQFHVDLPHVVVSTFTGVVRLVPCATGSNRSGRSHCGVGQAPVIHTSHTMTVTTGTLLWMAPEIFRGDCHYSGAVDVYSFGIVLWELATREFPWQREFENDTDAAFLAKLCQALQTGKRPTVPKCLLQKRPLRNFTAIMEQCWSGDPADRPTFESLLTPLAACLRAMSTETLSD